jgi:hypothetical protein
MRYYWIGLTYSSLMLLVHCLLDDISVPPRQERGLPPGWFCRKWGCIGCHYSLYDVIPDVCAFGFLQDIKAWKGYRKSLSKSLLFWLAGVASGGVIFLVSKWSIRAWLWFTLIPTELRLADFVSIVVKSCQPLLLRLSRRASKRGRFPIVIVEHVCVNSRIL